MRTEVRSYVFDSEGNEQEKTGLYRICFWTPSENTATSMPNANDKYKWQTIWRNNMDVEFMNKLFNDLGADNVNGMRWHEVRGKGKRSSTKKGYWWTITLKKNITPEQVYAVYKDFWKPETGVYVEVLGDSKYVAP